MNNNPSQSNRGKRGGSPYKPQIFIVSQRESNLHLIPTPDLENTFRKFGDFCWD